MIEISLCMIVKDEEENLPRCLNSIKDLVEEIIIIDTGSKDKTKEIALMYTDKVYDFTWVDDFSKARNFSFSKASKDYCMWMDADDVLENKIAFKKLKKKLNSDVNLVMMKYDMGFDSNNNPNYSYYRERIIANNNKNKWSGAVHEAIEITGKVIYSDVSICHYKNKIKDPKRNLKIYQKLLKEKKKLTPRDKFYYARELIYANKEKKAIKILKYFIDDKEAFIENRIEACRNLALCYNKLDQIENAYKALIKTFLLSNIKGEVCCDLGDLFFNSKEYEKAIFWYKCALNCKMDIKSGGFVSKDCYNYIPCLQICVCYYYLNDLINSKKYNDKAGKFKPYGNEYLYNKNFFDNLKSSN